MKIITSQSILLDALNKVQRAVSPKSVLPVLEGILFDARNGVLKLVSYDLEMGIETSLKVDVIEPGKIVISSKMISEIVRKLPDDDIVIDTDDNYGVHIECANSQLSINGLSADEFPELPTVDKNVPIQMTQGVLKEMIKQTIFAKSDDEIRPILTGVLFEVIGDKITFVALDGFRMAIKWFGCINEINQKAVVPGKTLTELMKLIDDSEEPISIYFSKNKILFETVDMIVISRLLDGEFINYNQLLPKKFDIYIQLKTTDLLNSCERAALFAKDSKNNMIKFEINENQLVIKSNSDTGNVHEVIDVVKTGDNLEIAFNAKYLMDALKIIQNEKIEMQFTTNVSPAIIQPSGENNYTYLVLPVRINR